MRVLVVEDEPVLAEAIAEWLQREAFAVDIAADGAAALERIAVVPYDVIVLDRDLPRVHGDEVAMAVMRAGGETRVLMLTAAVSIRDRVSGLAIGADDYLIKPFAFAELAARVHALARRARPAVPAVLERAGIHVDPARREVHRNGRPIMLGNREFAVLVELMRADGAVVSTEQLLERAWDENIDPFTNALRMAVMKLRRKLGAPDVLETVTGVGYRIR